MGHTYLEEMLTDLLDHRTRTRARAALVRPDRAANAANRGSGALSGKGGYLSFESDDAVDWVSDLMAAHDLTPIQQALDLVLNANTEYIELPAGEVAVAAAEVVASLVGKPPRSLPENVRRWIRGKPRPKAALVKKAQRAVRRIGQPQSELTETWKDSKGFRSWRGTLRGLLQRLGG